MEKIWSLLKRVGLNGFLLGLFGAIALGYLFPEWGAASSPVPWKPIINVGIALVFFFYGVKLDPNQLRQGLSNWKLHLLIQLTTFLLFPLLVFLGLQLIPSIKQDFVLGILLKRNETYEVKGDPEGRLLAETFSIRGAK